VLTAGRERHGDLKTLNGRWGTAYQSWDQVEQPASARYVEELKKRPRPQGAAAVDWTASLGTLTPEIQERMLAVRGRGMDWMRWWTSSSLWAYDAFRTSARQYDPKTLYSSNLCWPNFSPQMSMPFFRHMDVTMLDMHYTAGWSRPTGPGCRRGSGPAATSAICRGSAASRPTSWTTRPCRPVRASSAQ
jgi:hypothetical protein